MNILGVKVTGHNTGAALISGQRVVALAEERLNRIKHSSNMFPRLSIDYCLNHFGLKPADIDMVLMDQTNLRSKTRPLEIFNRETNGVFSRAKTHVINHHDAHAASAFFCSPFGEAATLVYDGTGEKFATHLGVYATETDTLYSGRNNRLYEIRKNLHLREDRFFPYTFGIGKLYSLITDYCNLGLLNEGKLMGLASYGNDSVLRAHPYDEWCREYNSHVLCNSNISYPAAPISRRIRDLKNMRPRIKHRLALFLRPVVRFMQKHLTRDGTFEVDIFPEIKLEKPKRGDEKLPDVYYSSLAYAAQKIFERVAILFGNQLKNITGSQNLCVAGGCGLNIDANMNFLDEVGFKNIFVQPASSDAGIPLGLALYGCHIIAGQPRFYEMKSASLGRSYSEAEILTALKEKAGQLVYFKSSNIAAEVAGLIAGGKIIGWFYGGAEYGPRALGHRSILCDTRRSDMRDVLNLKVKHREPWRPFAASVLEEKVGDFFEFNGKSPFMMLAANVKKDKQGKIPSVTHVDGTCRIQTLTPAVNGRYYDLVKNFYGLTQVPLILNTSFNLGGEPIVETPEDAVRTFLATKMDYLVLENYLITKLADTKTH
ncbi:MAG: carbamoyltransferase C-terminal domain-containing protein [Patescibacteria group bacterium]